MALLTSALTVLTFAAAGPGSGAFLDALGEQFDRLKLLEIAL